MADRKAADDVSVTRLEVIRQIRALERIPRSLREQQRLLAALADPKTKPDALVDLIDQCPTVAARVIGFANSPFFAAPDFEILGLDSTTIAKRLADVADSVEALSELARRLI